jgi:hypothetical protein
MGRGKLILALAVVGLALATVVAWRFAARRPVATALASATTAAAATDKVAPARSISPTGGAAPASTAVSGDAGSSTPVAATAAPQSKATTQRQEGPLTPVTVGDIQFIPWETMPTTKVSWDANGYDASVSYTFRRIGRFLNGKYKGAALLLAFIYSDDGPCKGDGCDNSYVVRYIQKGSDLFPLPKLSDSHVPDESVGRKGPVDLRPLKDLGVTSARPLDFLLPILEYPAMLQAGPRAVLQLAAEGVGLVDPALLRVAFHDAVYGDIWTTKSEAGPQKAFYEECTTLNRASPGDSDTCADMRKYTDNAFYVFRPDGTYLKYVYTPNFRPGDSKDVTWNEAGSAGASYDPRTLVGCSWDVADDVSVVSPNLVSEADLEPIGKVNATGDLLYGLKDKKQRLYQEFYDDYDSAFPTFAAQRGEDSSSEKQVSYEDFIKARPLVLWKDPFGRLIRFVNTDFVMPQTCEPILYLYPEQTESVTVQLGREIALTRSYPAYGSGWSVSAHPDGRLLDLRTGRKMPYLFWEGHSYILPKESEGFVVARAEVRDFLTSELPQLGLNERETYDFVAAWGSKLKESPYYFITFLDQLVIDRYYPLRIYPPPETTIRVFMDFKPLSAPTAVQPLSPAPPPQRHGFTAVEWGVVVR